MRLHIIRHGDPNYQDDCLTPHGREEARALSARMAGLPLHDLYSSPMGRARETASFTAGRMGLPVEILPWAAEVSLPGIAPDPEFPDRKVAVWNLPGYMLRQCEDEPAGWMNAPILSPPRTEKIFSEIRAGYGALLARYGMMWRDGLILAEKELPDYDIALFCHHGLGLALLSVMLGVPATLPWRSALLATTSVSTVLFEPLPRRFVNPRVLALGDTSHLYHAGYAK